MTFSTKKYIYEPGIDITHKLVEVPENWSIPISEQKFCHRLV